MNWLFCSWLTDKLLYVKTIKSLCVVTSITTYLISDQSLCTLYRWHTVVKYTSKPSLTVISKYVLVEVNS